ncbi:MAG: RusA family crossover junction endodeoxyribonuclease [Bacteroidetes bacterium]|nr:RusA family crossover junction endodeoxyribonuclease [Bacteroidota bacterium]
MVDFEQDQDELKVIVDKFLNKLPFSIHSNPMPTIVKRIYGIPYSQNKTRGNVSAPIEWTETLIRETSSLGKVKEACHMRATFFLPADKFPTDLPFGSDLDNLTKRLFDALNKTVFSEAKGMDSCVLSMYITKTKESENEPPGVLIEIQEGI